MSAGAATSASPAAAPSATAEAVGWLTLAAMVASTWAWQTQVLEPALGTIGASLATLGPIVGLGGWLAIDPARRGRALVLVQHASTTPRRAWLLTTLLLLAAVKVYAVPGFRELDGDGACHTTAAQLVADSLAAHEAPTWSNAWAMGFPFLQFYPPLFAWISGGLTALIGDPRLAVRLVLAAAHLASGWGAFALARRVLGEPAAAVVAALGYALTPWHLFEVFHWNRFPTALIWALLPWVLWVFERGRDGRRWVLACGAALAITALAHHGCAFFVGQFLGLWALLRWLEEPASLRPGLRDLVIAGALAFGLVAFFLVPYALESGLTFQPPGLGGVRFDFDQPHLATILMPSRRPIGHSGYLGLTLVLPGLVGAGWLAARRVRGGVAIAGCLAYAWLLALGHDLPFYGWIPFARALFFGGRYLLFVAIFLSLGLGAAWKAAAVRGWWSGDGGRVASAVALLVLLVDLGGTTFTHYRFPYPTGRGGEPRRAAFEQLRRSGEADLVTRALELPEAPRDHLWSALLPLTARHATAAPGLWGTLRSGMYVFQEWVGAAAAWRASRTALDEGALDRLALTGTSVVLARGQPGEASSGATAVAEPTVVPLGPMPGLVLASSRWRAMSPDLELPAEGWERPFGVESSPPGAIERIVAEMGVDRSAATARTVILRSAPAVALGESLGDGAPRLTVRSTVVTPASVTLDVELDRPAYLRLAQSYYPHQRVSIDGERTKAVPDVTYASVVTVPEGRHRIELRGGWSPLRKVLGVLSLAVGLFACGLEWRARRSRRGGEA